MRLLGGRKFHAKNLKKVVKAVDEPILLCYNTECRKMCGCSSMVESQPSKLVVWVRFPSPAPARKRDKAPRAPAISANSSAG